MGIALLHPSFYGLRACPLSHLWERVGEREIPEQDFPSNGHGKCATHDNETCHARSPLSSSLPQAGERDRDSLGEFHVKSAISGRSLDGVQRCVVVGASAPYNHGLPLAGGIRGVRSVAFPDFTTFHPGYRTAKLSHWGVLLAEGRNQYDLSLL